MYRRVKKGPNYDVCVIHQSGAAGLTLNCRFLFICFSLQTEAFEKQMHLEIRDGKVNSATVCVGIHNSANYSPRIRSTPRSFNTSVWREFFIMRGEGTRWVCVCVCV